MNIEAALKQFHATFDRGPTNFSELKTNRQGWAFFDGLFEDVYGQNFVYEPPAKGTAGRIGSFGADGRLGELESRYLDSYDATSLAKLVSASARHSPNELNSRI